MAHVPRWAELQRPLKQVKLGKCRAAICKAVTFGPAQPFSKPWSQLGGADSWGHSPFTARSGPGYLGQGQSSPSLVSAGDPGGDPG